jgi:tetratricopeptide (TPR) repeat protein
MTPEEAIQVADEVLLAHAGNPLTDIQRMILRESLAGKGYEGMEGYTPQHIKNEGKKLWDLLSEALGEKVSKTSFKGALERRWQLGDLIPKPPLLSIYNPRTWVGRKAIIDECLPKLQGQARVLWITGISGIGKTALGECLASQAWEGDPAFQWLYLEILEGQSPEFVSVAADLLAKLGDVDLDPQERNDPKRLMERLLRKLKVSRYWLQVDSLERLLNSEQPTETEFADYYWVTFIQRCLMEPNFVSRLVLTAQALPSSLAELEDRYPNLWQVMTLQGLLANQQDNQQTNEHLELFAKNGLSVDDISSVHLRRIGKIYEGHPLVLQVIAKEILALPFDGNLAMYWERYGNEFEQVTRDLQAEWVSPELYNQALQKRVRRRVEMSLKRLPIDAFDLLCRSSVYRRPVLESFWLVLLGAYKPERRRQAYQILNERALVEREGIHQNQFLIRQHNLVQAVAYDFLKVDAPIWKQAERQAAHLWLTAYEPTPNAENLETVRGYIEAFNHLCAIEAWNESAEILSTHLNISGEELGTQVGLWGYYRDQIAMYGKLCNKLSPQLDIDFLKIIGNAYRFLLMQAESRIFYDKALNLSIILEEKEKSAWVLHDLGLMEADHGRDVEAREYYDRALKIFSELAIHKGMALVNNDIARVEASQGKFTEAIERYRQSISIYPVLEDKTGYAWILYNLGQTLSDQGEFIDAQTYISQSLAVFQELGNKTGTAWSLYSSGILMLSFENQASAKVYTNEALALFRELENQSGIAWSLHVIGEIALKERDFRLVDICSQEELLIWHQIDNKIGIAFALKNLAVLHQQLRNRGIALEYCQQAVALATKLGIPLAEKCRQLEEELR